jgi:hypothetical protein
MAFKFFADQRMGSEYGGVSYANRIVTNTVQPKEPEALTLNERVRLGYLTGVEDNSMSLEDLRQFVGLRHTDGRPSWFVTGQPFGPTYGEAWQATQDSINQTQNWI